VPAAGSPGMHVELVSLIVRDYDEAIAFFTQALGFELVEDSPAVSTHDGHPKRWVVVRPPNARSGLLLALADGPRQEAAVGDQHGGRVGFFLRVDDFAAHYQRLQAAGVTFLGPPRNEPYGQVVVFLDVAGNRWDLLGPAEHHDTTEAATSTDPDLDLDVVLAQEQELLRTDCRRDPDRLRELLHPDFREHGASGRVWTLDTVIADLTASPAVGVHATELRAHRLTEDVVLVTYRTAGDRPALRSSTWLRAPDGRWQLRFHQGTLTTDT